MYLSSLPHSVVFAAIASFVISLFIVLTVKFHGKYSSDDTKGIQKNHKTPTPRIGGIAIVVGVLSAWFIAVPERSVIFGTLLIAGLPAFIFGFAEDLTKRISISARMLATMASGLLGWLLTGYSITSVDIPLFDAFLCYAFFSVIFTIFSISGISNAVNIIDGFNGLASGFVLIALLGLSTVALSVGDTNLAITCSAIAAAMFGFCLFNWPFGRLFLGDGGSYFCGFIVAWASIMLIERNPSISAFVPLLICIHPVIEVLFSIYRRKIRSFNPSHPDKLHLHNLVMRRIVKSKLKKYGFIESENKSLLVNSISGLVMLGFTLLSVISSNYVQHSTLLSALLCLLFATLYLTIYARIVRFRWCSPVAFLLPKRQVFFKHF